MFLLCLLTSPVGGVREVFAALERLHGFRQRRAGFGPVEEGRVERVREEFGGGDRDRPQGDAHALDSGSQEGSGQAHHPVSSHPAAGLRVQPGAEEVRGQVGGEPSYKPFWDAWDLSPQHHQFDTQAQVQYVGSSEEEVMEGWTVTHTVHLTHTFSVLAHVIVHFKLLSTTVTFQQFHPPILSGFLARGRGEIAGLASRPALAPGVLLAGGQNQRRELPGNMRGEMDTLRLIQSG